MRELIKTVRNMTNALKRNDDASCRKKSVGIATLTGISLVAGTVWLRRQKRPQKRFRVIDR
jgi:hypothetical protein